jgi:CheY-like chemotaxis protein
MSIQTPLRVLVAEDNEANAWLLERLLLKWGHTARVAVDGREALTLAQSGMFDVVLMDLHMPELDGLQVVEALREGSGRAAVTYPSLP